MTGLFILAFSIAATSVDGCAMLLAMSASATPYVLGARGYLCSEAMRGELLAEGVRVIAPVRESMADPPSPGLGGGWRGCWSRRPSCARTG